MRTLTLAATPANDNGRACPCGAPAGRDGLCASCDAELCAHIDAGRFHAADDEGAALLAGFDVSDSLRFV